MTEADPRREPYDKEKLRIANARERWIERTPPVEVRFPDDGSRAIKAPHNDDSGHLMRLGDTFGTRSADFLAIEITNLSAGVRSRGNREASQQEINAGIAFVAAVAPENELEAALAVQMAQNHSLTTDLLGRAAGAENLEHVQAFTNLAVKLQRTFTAQIEAIARMRGKGQQTVRVEHVTVESGAQAIVGDVHHHAPRGGGEQLKSETQPYGAIESQGRAALPCPDPEGNGVPIPGHAKRAVSNPRRAVTRRPAGKSERA